MEVTKENFAEVAAEIEGLLPTAAFVAIDEEMTGISVPGQQERYEDLPQERYAKIRKAASTYNIIQFGVAIFHEEHQHNGLERARRYICRAYNFYVFPEVGNIGMEATSVAFNRDHGMDWNKWIRQGIPYLTRQAADKLEAKLRPKEEEKASQAAKGNSTTQLVLTQESDISATTKALESFRRWLKDDGRKNETEFDVMTTNAYLRKYLHQIFEKEFPDIKCESRQVEGARGISTFVALRLNKDQEKARDVKIQAEKQEELVQKVGFTRIFRALASSKKPLIGHNFMGDLLFAVSHFECQLPEKFSEFKTVIQGLFPQLFDTKMLAMKDPFKFIPDELQPEGVRKPSKYRPQRFGSTALGEVYKVFVAEAEAAKEAARPGVEIAFAPGFDRYGPGCDASHEAGYDAYITGYCFAHMANDAFEQAEALNGRSPTFRGLFNFNLRGEDEPITPGTYIHVSGRIGKNVADLKSSFREIKAPGKAVEGNGARDDKPLEPARVDVRMINDESAFVIFPHDCEDAVTEFLKRTGGLKNGLSMQTFEEWCVSRGVEKTAVPARMKREASEPLEPPAKRAKSCPSANPAS